MLISEQVALQQEQAARNALHASNLLRADGADDEGFLPVERLRRQYIDFLGTKMMEIDEQKQARQYYHGAQWTADEIRILRARRQPVVTFNRVSRKINNICGLLQKLRQDPKAYPRKPGADEGADVATAAVRYVCDKNLWEMLQSEAARFGAIDGVSGVELKLSEGDKGDPDILMSLVFGDDYFYDPRSFRFDFADARYHGIAKWLDIEEAVELFPDKEEEIRALLESGSDLTTYSDREFKWIMVNEGRVRLVEHWYKLRGQWKWCFYISNTMLDQGDSPFRDETGKSMSRFVMFSAAVDHDGDRYGFFRNMKGPQDEINQRRSRGLFLSNSKRLIIDKGAVDNVETTRREWARPDGIIEKNPNVGDVKADDTKPELEAQLAWLQEAKAELDSFANVQPFQQGEMPQNVSGRAVNLVQQAGIAELGPYILAFRDWKIRVYRLIWNMAQQFWTGERWIRVTDDENLAQFIQINGVDVDEWGRPVMVNAVGSLDVDILLDEGPDVINMMADTFDVLSQMAQKGANIPPQVLIELAPITGSIKQRILKMLQPVVDPNEARAKQLQLGVLEATAREKEANAYQRLQKGAEAGSKAQLNAAQIFEIGLQAVQGVQIPEQTAQPSQYQTGPAHQAPPGVTSLPPPEASQSLPGAFAASSGHSAPPIEGARRARDGNWYVSDPRRQGQYLMVA